MLSCVRSVVANLSEAQFVPHQNASGLTASKVATLRLFPPQLSVPDSITLDA